MPKDISDYLGFVYIIKHRPTGMYYVGKKKFWFKKTQKPLKGRKNKRHSLVESDWKTYWGSSEKFKEFVKQHKKSEFDRTVLHLCTTAWELSFLELTEQIDRGVLFDDKSFNEMLNVRLRKRK